MSLSRTGIAALAALALGASAAAAATTQTQTDISVTYDGAKFIVTNSIDKAADSYGYYDTNYNSSGWGYLDAHMQTDVTSTEQHLSFATSLGYLEGYATCETMKTFYPNFYSAVFGSSEEPGAETVAFIEDNYAWMAEQAEANYEDSEQWYAVKLMLNQMNGMLQGLIEGCPSADAGAAAAAAADVVDYSTLSNPTLTHLLLMNAWGDLYQITVKYLEPGRPKGLRHAPSDASRGAFSEGDKQAEGGSGRHLREASTFVERCSAIVKLLPNYADVVYGHATWDSYESLGPRIFKHVNYPLRSSKGAFDQQYDVYFSSSPGLLSSVDDFFTVSGKWVQTNHYD
jgi:hypothetical protein